MYKVTNQDRGYFRLMIILSFWYSNNNNRYGTEIFPPILHVQGYRWYVSIHNIRCSNRALRLILQWENASAIPDLTTSLCPFEIWNQMHLENTTFVVSDLSCPSKFFNCLLYHSIIKISLISTFNLEGVGASETRTAVFIVCSLGGFQ